MNLSPAVGNLVEGMLGQSDGKLHHSVDGSLPPLKLYVCIVVIVVRKCFFEYVMCPLQGHLLPRQII